MSATGPGQTLHRPEQGASIVQAWQAWTGQGAGKAMGALIMGALFGYLGNLVVAKVVPQGAFSTGVFWSAASSLVFGMAGYARTAGLERLIEGIAAAPQTIARILGRDGTAGRSHLLWGAGAATLSSLAVSPTASLMVGITFLASVPSAAGRLIATLIRPTAPGARMDGPTGFLVGALGAAAAFVVGAVVKDGTAKLVIGGACVAGGWLLGQGGGRPGGTASSFLLIAAAALGVQAGLDLFHPLSAFAQNEGGEIVPPQYGDGPRPIPGEMGVPQYGDGPRPIPGEMGNPLQGGGWWSQWGDDVGGGFGGGAGAMLGWLLGSFGGWLRTGGGGGFYDPGSSYDPPAPPHAPPPPYQPPPARPAAAPPSVPDTAEDLPTPAQAAPPPPPMTDTAEDLPPAPDPVVADRTHAPATRDAVMAENPAEDLPPVDDPLASDPLGIGLTYAPATRDAVTAENPAEDLPPVDDPPAIEPFDPDLPPVDDPVAIEPLGPDPDPGDGEVLLDEDGKPVTIASLAKSDLPTVEPGEDLPPAVGDPGGPPEETEAQKIAKALRALKDRAPGTDAAVIDRVLSGIDLNAPSVADLDKLNRLAKAAINRIEGAEAYPKAAADAALQDNLVWGATIGAAIGQGVASVVWGPVTAGAIYGAAGGMDFNAPLEKMAGRMAFGAAFGGALGFAFGKAGEAFPKLLASKAPALADALNAWEIPMGKALASTAVGSAISGGWATLMGESRSDVKLAYLAGGVGGLVGNYAAQEAVRATELAKLHATFDTTQGVLTPEMALKYGQQAVSPSFSSAGKFKGAKIEDVALSLAVGGDDLGGVVHPGDIVKLPGEAPYTVRDPGEINVQYMWANGEPFVVNNRSTTTLSLAGKKPVNPQDMTGRLPRWGPDSEVSVLTRLTEMGNQPSTVSKVRLVDKRSSPIAYEVPLYDPKQAR